jgi:glycosyltransferase involved in cell wall biosynthesis/Tfp pilus assembly protein PilF
MINPLKPDYGNTPASSQRISPVFLPADPSAAPFVSILTPSYNAGAIFYETATSVFRQTLQQWEWVIVNDGSTDPEAVKILDEFRTKDPRIRVIDHPQNKGLSAARNTGYNACRAELVFQLDADDMIEPTALEKMAWHLQTHPEYAFVTGYTVGFGSKEYLWRNGFHNGKRFVEENMVNPTCMVRKAVQQAVGGYDEANRGGCEDWEFWLNCAEHGFWGSTIPDFLDWYRCRDTGREHWVNIYQSEKGAQFRARLKERYPGIYQNKFPQIAVKRQSLASSVRESAPFANRLVKKNPRLLLIVPHFELGGADKFNFDLIRQLQRERGYEITVVATRESTHPWQHEMESLTPDVFALNQFLLPGDYPLFLRYLIDSRQPDAVCVSNSQLGYQLLPYLRAHFPNVPFVDYLHMEEEGWMNGGYPRHSLLQQSQLSRTGVTSQHLKNWLVQRGGEADAIEVCTCNVDVNKFSSARFDRKAAASKWKVDPSKPVILFAGRVCEQKQPKVFAEVMRQLARKSPHFSALVAGDGPDFPWLKDFVEKERLKQVRLLGAVSNDDVAELLAISDIFFLPSQWEGIALTIYEAMAMGVVPVGAVVGGQAELVTPDCGILVERGPKEIADYANALLRLISNTSERRQLADAARRRVENHFPIEKLGRQMDAFIQTARQRHAQNLGKDTLPVEMASLLADEVVENLRAQAQAGLLARQCQELMPLMTHTLLWQSCLRAGKVLLDVNQPRLALQQFEDGLRHAHTSKIPTVQFAASLELAKVIAPLDLARARTILQKSAEFVDVGADPGIKVQIDQVMTKINELRPAKAAVRPPLVSVVIPCYKQAHFLGEAVESVVAQTFRDWEIIIVNDGSPDDTTAVAKALIARHPDRAIRLVEKSNGGLPSARNAGFRAGRGEFLLPLDADDKIKPDFLARLVPILDSKPKVGFAYTHIQHFGQVDTEFPLPDFDADTIVNKDNIACVCSLIRRSAWEKVGGYNEAMREGYEDWDFWIGCVEKGFDGHCVHEPLFLYRKNGASMLTGANQKREKLIAQIVLNHPKLYDDAAQQAAKKVLAKYSAATSSAVTSSSDAPAARNGRRSLRITYLISSILGVTGGNQTLLRQAEEMRRRGHDVTIVTHTPKPDWFQFQTRVIQAPAGQPLAPSVPPSDIVVATYFANAHELVHIPAAVKIYYAQGDQFVFEDATMPDTAENRRWRELSKSSYLLPGIRFVPNSRNLASAVKKLCGRAHDAILPVCTDQTIFRPLQRSVPGSRARLLIVGPDARGSENEPLLFKGIQDIHDALQLLAKKYPHFTAVRMSGTPPEIFARFPCEFYVAPSDEMKTVLYGTSHIHIYASHYDSCPRPPQEAMAAGCAVVCTATPGAMEYCRDGVNSLLVPVQSPEAIAAAVEKLIHDHALREKLVQGGLATAREYPREREWDEWESILFRFADEAAKPITNKPARKPRSFSLPPCALLGQLDQARELLKQKDFTGAWNLTCRALEQRPFHPEAFLHLAKIAQAAGDFETARRCARKASDLAPQWKTARQFLKAIPGGSGKRSALQIPIASAAPRLTVCMITKNEAQFLEQCLRSVRDVASQIVVVDTGSSDRTLEIAREFNAEVHSMVWNDDFSAARNEALRHATGDWVLSLDADEELSAEHKTVLQEEMRSSTTLGWRIPIIDKGSENEGCHYVPRLFRNAPGLFFVGRIHEQVFSSLEVRAQESGMENNLGRTALWHHGYSKEIVKARGKTARNLRLLHLAAEESPDDPNLKMNLGLETVRSGQLDAGLAYYREALQLLTSMPADKVIPELRETLLTQFTTHLLGARRFAEIVDLWQQPFPRARALTASQHFMLGVARLELKQAAEAANEMRACLAKRGQPVLSPVNTDILGAGPRHCLARALAELGQKEEADQQYRDAISEEPTSRPARFDYAVFHFHQGRPIEALKLANQLVAENSRDLSAWLFGGQVALSNQELFPFACDWTSQAVQNFPDETAIASQRAEALTFSQQLEAALPLWLRLAAGKTPRHLAALVLTELLVTGTCNRQFGPMEKTVSQEFLKWYRQLIKFRVNPVVSRINERFESLRPVLPSAAEILSVAMRKAEAAAAV